MPGLRLAPDRDRADRLPGILRHRRRTVIRGGGDHRARAAGRVAAQPRSAGGRRARAARVRDRAHRRRRADAVGGAPGSAGRAGRSPRDRDPLPPWSALAQGARDPQGGGLLESAQSAGRDRRVGGERGSESPAVLNGSREQGAGSRPEPTQRFTARDWNVPLPAPGSPLPAPDYHAEGGTRTPTGLRPLAPEASASTSSTTSARSRNGEYRRRYNLKSTLGLTASTPISILRWLGGQSLHRPQPAGAT